MDLSVNVLEAKEPSWNNRYDVLLVVDTREVRHLKHRLIQQSRTRTMRQTDANLGVK